jgi:hypothetical protein
LVECRLQQLLTLISWSLQAAAVVVAATLHLAAAAAELVDIEQAQAHQAPIHQPNRNWF